MPYMDTTDRPKPIMKIGRHLSVLLREAFFLIKELRRTCGGAKALNTIKQENKRLTALWHVPPKKRSGGHGYCLHDIDSKSS